MPFFDAPAIDLADRCDFRRRIGDEDLVGCIQVIVTQVPLNEGDPHRLRKFEHDSRGDAAQVVQGRWGDDDTVLDDEYVAVNVKRYLFISPSAVRRSRLEMMSERTISLNFGQCSALQLN